MPRRVARRKRVVRKSGRGLLDMVLKTVLGGRKVGRPRRVGRPRKGGSLFGDLGAKLGGLGGEGLASLIGLGRRRRGRGQLGGSLVRRFMF